MGHDKTQALVETALELGFRLFDTASYYGNEAQVGAALKAGGVPREEVFVTTKAWTTELGHDAALAAFDRSCARLGLDYVDLYLIHWPDADPAVNLATWQALIELREAGRVRSIGVSNFLEADLKGLVDATGVVPAVNQISLHPAYQRRDLVAVNRALGIVTEAWSPFGRGADLGLPTVVQVAAEVGRTPAQVVERWLIQEGIVVFPKTARPQRLAENLDVFGFELTDAQMAAMRAIPETGKVPW
jgi:2,5-diketo-D-gluconate reductase A